MTILQAGDNTSKKTLKAVLDDKNDSPSCWRTEPPNPYIMGGSTSNTKIAIDTLVLNLYVEHHDGSYRFFESLMDQKLKLQDEDILQETFFDFKNKSDVTLNWNLQRQGIKFYPYVLRAGDIILAISKREKDASVPSMRLHIGSMSCQDSVLAAYEKVKAFLSRFAVIVKKDSVSRVDICHDFLLDIRDKRVKIFNEDQCVFKAVDTFLFRHHRNISGLQFGKGDIVLRIYDKLLELKRPHQEHKLDFFFDLWLKEIDKREETKEIFNVTRVEFQLRKGALNDFLENGCLSDFLNNRLKIWKYLTVEWFRHCNKDVDRASNNQSKVKVSFFWLTVQNILDQKEIAQRTKKKIITKSLDGLRAQVRGLLVTICAGKDYYYDDYFGFMDEVQTIAREEMQEAMKDYDAFALDFMKRKTSMVLV